jgi:hypothetical protein
MRTRIVAGLLGQRTRRLTMSTRQTPFALLLALAVTAALALLLWVCGAGDAADGCGLLAPEDALRLKARR